MIDIVKKVLSFIVFVLSKFYFDPFYMHSYGGADNVSHNSWRYCMLINDLGTLNSEEAGYLELRLRTLSLFKGKYYVYVDKRYVPKLINYMKRTSN